MASRLIPAAGVRTVRNTDRTGRLECAMRSLATACLVALATGLGACEFEAPDPIPPPLADPRLGCAFECHGDDLSNAPPRSMSGDTDPAFVAVGAHRKHLTVAPAWHRQVECQDCHTVPAEVDAPGHRDGIAGAEVTFSMIAGPGSVWNGTTCTTGCHGSAALGGAQPTPTWTRVDGAQATCGSCHGLPPPPPHTVDNRCARCHPTLEEDNVTFRVPESHIDGIVDVVDPGATGGCTACHGSQTAAPPFDLVGNMAPTTRGVGAHAAHLATSTWRRAIPCSSCHRVPLTRDSMGHLDGDNVAEVRFNQLNRDAAYAAGTARCTNLYCHGNGRDSNGSASWITPGALGCGSCHSVNGNNMSGAHRRHLDRNVRCSDCHSTVVDDNRNIINAVQHVNGVHEVKLKNGQYDAQRRRCQGACHGTRDWNGNQGPGGDGDGDDD